MEEISDRSVIVELFYMNSTLGGTVWQQVGGDNIYWTKREQATAAPDGTDLCILCASKHSPAAPGSFDVELFPHGNEYTFPDDPNGRSVRFVFGVHCGEAGGGWVSYVKFRLEVW